MTVVQMSVVAIVGIYLTTQTPAGIEFYTVKDFTFLYQGFVYQYMNERIFDSNSCLPTLANTSTLLIPQTIMLHVVNDIY
jgi:hypothetical protein